MALPIIESLSFHPEYMNQIVLRMKVADIRNYCQSGNPTVDLYRIQVSRAGFYPSTIIQSANVGSYGRLSMPALKTYLTGGGGVDPTLELRSTISGELYDYVTVAALRSYLGLG